MKMLNENSSSIHPSINFVIIPIYYLLKHIKKYLCDLKWANNAFTKDYPHSWKHKSNQEITFASY